jgi:hypothetical protein
MKVSVDFSVALIDGTAFGVVSGDLDLAAVPPIGGTILFNEAPGIARPQVANRRFIGHLDVERVMYRPTSVPGVHILLSLQTVIVETASDAEKIMEYLENGFGLFSDRFLD